MNPYEVLGLQPTATDEEIKDAYRKLIRKFHPDVSKEPDREAKTRELNEAMEILGSEDRKKIYDATGQTKIEVTIEQKAIEIIAGIVSQAIDQGVVNPIELVRANLGNQLTQTLASEYQMTEKIKDLEKYRTRVRTKAGSEIGNLDGLVGRLVEEKIQGLNRGIAHMKEGQQVMRRGLELLEGLEFVPDEIVQAIQFGGFTTGGTGSIYFNTTRI